MPDPKDVKAAQARGVNPYAVMNAMAAKHHYDKAKREAIVKGVTRSVLKRKK